MVRPFRKRGHSRAESADRARGRRGDSRDGGGADGFGAEAIVSGRRWRLRLQLLGIGAMNSPRFPPAGLLIRYRGARIVIDGGPGAAAAERVHAWLLTDEHAELRPAIADLAARHRLDPAVRAFAWQDLTIEPQPVVHTNHPTYGYLMRTPRAAAAWAPEFWTFPAWAANLDILFAEAASWNRPIHFRGGVGGHQPVLRVAQDAQQHRVQRLIYVHIGRPTIAAIDRGEQPPFGEWGRVGAAYVLPEART